MSEGCRWQIAVSLYLEGFCRRKSTTAMAHELNESLPSDIKFKEDSTGEFSNEDGTSGKWPGVGSSPDAFAMWKMSVILCERINEIKMGVPVYSIAESEHDTRKEICKELKENRKDEHFPDLAVSVVRERAGRDDRQAVNCSFRESSSQSEGKASAAMSTSEDTFNDASRTQKNEDMTVTTAAHSTDDSFSVFDSALSSDCDPDSDLDSSFASASVSVSSASVTISASDSLARTPANEWSIIVNGTRYIGSQRSGTSSHCDLSEESDSSEAREETIKERNSRLLTQDRINRARLGKFKISKRRNTHHVEKLQVVKEDDVMDDEERGASKEVRVLVDNVATVDSSKSYFGQTEVESVLRRKIRRYGGAKRASRQLRKRIHQRNVGFTSGFGWHNTAVQAVTDIIKLYSCSAFRYAMFGSNRRFKPGD